MCIHILFELSQGSSLDPGPSPPDYASEQLEFLPEVLYDHVPVGKNFGDVHSDAEPSYTVVSLPSLSLLVDDAFAHK